MNPILQLEKIKCIYIAIECEQEYLEFFTCDTILTVAPRLFLFLHESVWRAVGYGFHFFLFSFVSFGYFR